jgi:plastocyanin
MTRKILWGVSMALALGCAALSAETVTLPAAASIVGGAPFFSDVRAFNTSYTESLTVDATYRCFIGSPCPGTAPQMTFTLAPRESAAFDDIVVSAFHEPNSAGGVEFDHSGASGQLVVTSRLFSTFPTPTVGMFIPGLDNSAADPVTVLTSIRNRGAGAGFRTNVGVFNPEDSAVSVTFSIFDANGAAVGAPVSRPVGGHSGVQVSQIFLAAGADSFATDNAVIVVSATGEVFSYAAVIDNATTDPIFVVGSQDQPPQPITPGATSTPTNTPPGPTATRTPTPTVTPQAGTRTVNVGAGPLSMSFVDQVTGTSTSTIPVGTTINWVWVGGLLHSTTSQSSSAEVWDSGVFGAPHSFPHTFNTAGTFAYICQVHGIDMTGTVIVNP